MSVIKPQPQTANDEPTPVLPDLIRVERHGGSAVVYIDGEVMPWAIARDPIDVIVDADGFATVRLTLAASAVEVVNDTHS